MLERAARLSTLAVVLCVGAPVLAATAADAGPSYNKDVAPILAKTASRAIGTSTWAR